MVIDNKLKFHNHVAMAVKKASGILIRIRRTFECRDMTTIPLLYKSLVRSHLEYGNVIWHPRYVIDTKAIEKVQKRATKMIPCLQDKPYRDRLRALKLPSMQHRRRRGDMIQVYKIMNGMERVDPGTFFTLFDDLDMGSRGHRLKIKKPRYRLKLKAGSFSHRVVNDWNSLPDSVVAAETINHFKYRIDKHWESEQYISLYSD